MTRADKDALRELHVAIARHEIALMQLPHANVMDVARESQHAALCLQLIAEFLTRDGAVTE